MRLFLWTALLLAAALHVFSPGRAAEPAAIPKPNFIVVLADDLGWSDLGCYGSTFYETPELDRLAREAMRFTDAYAACPVCSPTRAALLTGKYPARLHLTDWLPGRGDLPDQRLARPVIEPRLPLTETTLAKALHRAGYVSASIGKWHLGASPIEYGFDQNVAGNEAGSPASYFFPYQNPRAKIPGLDQGAPGEYLTDRLTSEAEAFLERNQARPFLLYVPHYAVHIPLAAKQELIARFEKKATIGGHQTNTVYAAMIQSLDQSVGRLRQKLVELAIDQRTIFLFTSDNGGLSTREGPRTPATSTAPWRAGKGHLFEGGLRVPLLIHWPGVTRPGSVCSRAVSSFDLFPTILEMAGLALATSDSPIDGRSLAPLLQSKAEWASRALYWHYPHYSNQGGKPGAAMRQDNFKLIEFYDPVRSELYDLERDLGETNNLANQLPERMVAMTRDLAKWRTQVGAQMMTPNPGYIAAQDKTPPPPDLVRQQPDGQILLHARDVRIHGSRVRYEPQPHKNTVGYWTQLEDWVSWEFEVRQPGGFEVEILQGCGPGSGGSEVAFSAGGQTLSTVVQATRGFQDFIPRVIGSVQLPRPGRFSLTVKPLSKPSVAVMDLRSVTLRPVTR